MQSNVRAHTLLFMPLNVGDMAAVVCSHHHTRTLPTKQQFQIHEPSSRRWQHEQQTDLVHVEG